ncbi:hypothetical protein MVES1_000895 [Malassezia vespertilionis]|uniref:Peroxisomal membrane protein 4 n=1 Tax=Malassezia vespertilionis TaxID=2020962 RepID=A0A2N1JDV0_9BASI|nr:uncharacterized protein MVES1_000895 [Malassezia vespertilionis]PKI84728.1 hypothetical protein MVES_000843 [Malassezia vespertilionis]WFD05565.1 hypothetical protein MVES1_000895 [Malassezia vespertilionis]
MAGVQATLTRFILNPANHDVLALVKGARNGLVYGTKIRFPHALVMTFLFGSGTPSQKMNKILQATRQHATRLALYVLIYKSFLLVQRDMFSTGKDKGKNTGIQVFLAGFVGGWYMFGERTPVNEQIVLYCVGRCIASLLPREPVPPNYPANKVIPINNNAHRIFAALVWGWVMWLFMFRRQKLNGGLVNSMDCAYYLWYETDT